MEKVVLPVCFSAMAEIGQQRELENLKFFLANMSLIYIYIAQHTGDCTFVGVSRALQLRAQVQIELVL